ncbi:GlxA family transcriptional regulator [Mesorhizobium sp. M2A.F.Ca.ET.042.01.1.1]|uniref:GlxA family transcriptional regulator n=1 Tax=Mesorhizobium sp. M2A.F.Ca.ET.042.01.1.1 TaxID=2496745 RepID=UPI000FCB2E99|nr:GlxA family transcriptional regulator [Mesorhizobium sp. M2A.F.Ca.ET.042.01.1.1]RUX26061.1 GlxA family transcriptional regulator [Mesorhizobium sp. M2A.F.Ca.ET.042.01.1.1]
MTEQTSRLTQSIGFLLLPGFALMSYASATEPLRAANLLAGQPLYDVTPLSLDGNPVSSSSGAIIPCERLDPTPRHIVFICAGGNPSALGSPDLYAILRQLSRNGVRLGGISGGPFILAAAGLLNGRDFTIHWEHSAALIEAFPHLNPRQARFVLDGNRITCGGGVAPLDMMHALISERMGADFARRVSDWYLHTAVAEPAAPQRASTAERFRVNHPVLLNVLEKMEAAIEQPLDRGQMAMYAGVSQRHLDRLFAGYLNAGYSEVYRNFRLAHAKRLLQQSPLSISEIAVATGFSSTSHFSRAYAAVFGKSPKQERR